MVVVGWGGGGSSAGVTGARSQKPIRSFLNPDANSKAHMQLCSICRHVNIHARLSRRRPQRPVCSRPVPPRPFRGHIPAVGQGGQDWPRGAQMLGLFSVHNTPFFCVALRLTSGGSFSRADSTERLQLHRRARLQAGWGGILVWMVRL